MTQELQTTEGRQVSPAAAYIASLGTAVSRRVMTQELRKVARILGASDWRQVDWSTLSAPNVRAIMARVEGAPASRNKTLAALKGVARMAYEQNQIGADAYERIRMVRGDSGHREPAGRNVEAWELAALMRVCAKDPSPAGARDGAMIALAAKSGARRAEIVSIDYEHVTFTDGDHAAAEIRVIGKGNKERVLYLDGGALLALNDWLGVRGRAPGPLFCAITQPGELVREHRLSTTSIHRTLQKRSTEAGLTDLTWHDFRRSFAGSLLDAGEDIATVSAMMGHAGVNTTARYDRRPAEQRRKAARRISVPHYERAAQAR